MRFSTGLLHGLLTSAALRFLLLLMLLLRFWLPTSFAGTNSVLVAADPAERSSVHLVRIAEMIKGGEKRSYRIPIDGSVKTFTVYLAGLPDSRDLEVHLLTPLGKNVPLDRDPVTHSSYRLLEKGDPGEWTLEVSSSRDVRILGGVEAEAALNLEPREVLGMHRMGDEIELEARLVSSGPLPTRAFVRVRVLDAQGNNAEELVLQNAGGDHYSAVFSPKQPGHYHGEFVATGSTGRYSFQRLAQTASFPVTSTGVRITGVVGHRHVVVAENNDLEIVRLEIELQVEEAGRYIISGELRNGGGDRVSSALEFISLATGKQYAFLNFPGADVVKALRDGPLRLARVTVLLATGQELVVDQKTDLYEMKLPTAEGEIKR